MTLASQMSLSGQTEQLRPHQQQQQTEKMKGKAQDKIEGAKSSGEKVKEKTKEPIRRKL